MKKLSELLAERGIKFDHIDRRIMCLPHILNICSKHIVEEYADADFAAVSDAWVNALGDVVDKDKYIEALQRDPIALGRDIVWIIRSSSLRREGFCNTIVTGNQMSWFTNEEGEPIQLPILELLHDVKTRWDSIYYMINRLRILRQALDVFFQAPTNKDITDRQLGEMDWQVIKDMEIVLEVPHSAQQLMSHKMLPHLSMHLPRCAPYIKVGLKYANKYYSRMDKTNAYAIAMFVDPTLCLTWIEEHWSPAEVLKVRTVVLEKMVEYQSHGLVASTMDLTLQATALRPSQPLPIKLSSRYRLPTLQLRQPSSSVQTVEQELASYVTSVCSPEGTDSISFWVMSRSAYPTLYRLAMDYLPIQASSVPCERVFSSASETMMKRRNRISPILMEAIQMTKFFLKKERLNFTEGWVTLQKDMHIAVADNNLLATIVETALSHDLLTHRIDDIIGAIGEDKGDEMDDNLSLF
ncbi:hypothetical protein SCLCIDRAFT_31420 [Scleroderma citrinum Foug A]|uniref:HAT C-terminal dimerisation domain-containing protein n=1 Tax=Scleroderma citrinum Foug A TaxID=1036808 RepID=A0A0C2YWM3_9AGAM|nr:hypothetical protein SCLCIDRAFT_31420 [Scleroderma citrinum Foug A]